MAAELNRTPSSVRDRVRRYLGTLSPADQRDI